MKNLSVVACSIYIVASSVAVGQSYDCEAVLRTSSFDTTDITTSETIVIKNLSDVCSRDYSSEQEAEAAARSTGLSVGYAGVSLGFRQGKASSGSSVSIRDSEFCKQTVNDIRQQGGTSYSKQIASIAVEHWLECIQAVGANRIFLEYTPQGENTYFTGKLHHKVSEAATTKLYIKGLDVVGTAKDSVTCKVGGIPISQQQLAAEPFEVTETPVSISCEKSENGAASVGFQTTKGGLDYAHLPSPEQQAETDLDQLRSEITSSLDELRRADDAHASSLANVAVEVSGRLDAAELAIQKKVVLAVALVRNTRLVREYSSPGVQYNPRNGIVTFPNPDGAAYVPIVSHLRENRDFATETHFIRSILSSEEVKIRRTPLDTGARNNEPTSFSLVIVRR